MKHEKEYAIRVFRKLNTFLQLGLPVHLKLINGTFLNGTIIDLSSEKFTLVLKEDMMGTIPILLEDIKEDSICLRKELK